MNVEKTATTELSLEACLFAKKQLGNCSNLTPSSSERGETALRFLWGLCPARLNAANECCAAERKS